MTTICGPGPARSRSTVTLAVISKYNDKLQGVEMNSYRLAVALSVGALAYGIACAHEAQARCQSKLIDKSFSCDFTSDSEFHPSGSSCLEFSSDDDDELKFDFFDIGDASIEGIVAFKCSCDPVGTGAAARLNHSKSKFTCTGLEFVSSDGETFDFPWAAAGKVNVSGKRLKVHEVNLLAASFSLRCAAVSSCRDGSLSVQSDVDDGVSAALDDYYALQELRRSLEIEFD